MSEPTAYGPSPAGSVVLNLAEGIGALIIEAGAEHLGAEIEISREGATARTHAMVRERTTHPHPRYAAVYTDLPAGTYTLWRDATTPSRTVAVTSGEIVFHRWDQEGSQASI